MPIDLTTLTSLPSAPRVETFPLALVGNVETTIAAGNTFYIPHNAATSDWWVIGIASILSWVLKVSTVAPETSEGANLQIVGATDAGLAIGNISEWPLPFAHVSQVAGMQICYPQIRFRLSNILGAQNIVVTGWIRVQGGVK
jgi:hypothetical protein